MNFVKAIDALRQSVRQKDVRRIYRDLTCADEEFQALSSDKKEASIHLRNAFVDAGLKAISRVNCQDNRNVNLYVFFHSREQLSDEVLSAVGNGFWPVNLDLIDIPHELRASWLSQEENRALLAEYLGIMTVQPTSHMVGCFTYSIPRKFSYRWGVESGHLDVFLPDISFEDVREIEFNQDTLYGVEFKLPNDRDGRYYDFIPQRLVSSGPPKPGPFKGSFVVSRGIFEGLQACLRDAAAELVSQNAVESIPQQASQFGASTAASRSPDMADLDVLRHTVGNVLERVVANYLGQSYAPTSTRRIGDLIQSKRLRTPLAEKSRCHSQQGLVVLTFVDSGYVDVALEWVRHIKGLGLSCYVVVCFDADAEKILKAHDVNTVLVPYGGDFGGIMAFRTRCILSVLKTGVDVVHSDVDAFWKKNPIDEWFRGASEDILSSQGTIWPPEALQAWGFVLCSGLCLYKANAPVIALMEDFASEIVKYGSDQKAFNCALLREGVQWSNVVPAYRLSYNSMEFSCFREKVVGRSDRLTVGLLPHADFQRLKEPQSRPYVAHLISTKGDPEDKLNVDHQTWGNSREPRRRRPKGSGGLVWLGSYPRSGNTMLRIALKDAFGLWSRSVYNDVRDIGADPQIAKKVGHVHQDWSHLARPVSSMRIEDYAGFDFLRVKSQPQPLKTHSVWSRGMEGDKAVYIYRDGRAALASHAAYKQKFAGDTREREEIIEELILAPDRFCLGWAENTRSWMGHPDELRLDVRFEEFVINPEHQLERIGDFLGCVRRSDQIAKFQELKEVNKDFFRAGVVDSWKQEINDYAHLLFWLISYKEMYELGYNDAPRELTWIVPHAGQVRQASLPEPEMPGVDAVAQFAGWLNRVIDRHLSRVAERSSEFLLGRLFWALECLAVFLRRHGRLTEMRAMEVSKDKLDDIFKENGWVIPIIYVVCPTFNASQYIDATLMSIAGQEGRFYLRLHVQDGQSADGTTDKVACWSERLHLGICPVLCEGVNVTCSVGQDAGMYDALNKGAEAVNLPDSAIMTWINADDCLLPGAFATMLETVRQHPSIEWVIPGKRTFGEWGELRGCGAPRFAQAQIASGRCDGVQMPVIQQEGVYWRTGLWKRVGGVKSNMRLAGDWDLWRRFAEVAEPHHLGHPLAMFRKRSGQLGADKGGYEEEMTLVRKKCDVERTKVGREWKQDRVLYVDVDRTSTYGTRYVIKIGSL